MKIKYNYFRKISIKCNFLNHKRLFWGRRFLGPGKMTSRGTVHLFQSPKLVVGLNNPVPFSCPAQQTSSICVHQHKLVVGLNNPVPFSCPAQQTSPIRVHQHFNFQGKKKKKKIRRRRREKEFKCQNLLKFY